MEFMILMNCIVHRLHEDISFVYGNSGCVGLKIAEDFSFSCVLF